MLKKNYTFLPVVWTIIAVLLIFTGCTKKDHDEERITTVFLSSIPGNAAIIINGECTGNFTPDTIELEEGIHTFGITRYMYIIPPETTITLEGEEEYIIDFVLSPAPVTGYLDISSNPSNLEIYVDCYPTGYATPAIIEIPTGLHSVWVHREGFEDPVNEDMIINEDDTLLATFAITTPQKKVLLEDYTNVSCMPCADVDPFIETIQREHEDHVVLITYHVSWPSPTDPMYLIARDENNARISFYDGINAPNVFLDGTRFLENASDTASLMDSLEKKLQDSTSIAIWGEVKSDTLHVTIFCENELISFSGKLYIALMEKERTYETAPGSNGLTEFHNIIRDFIPTSEGTSINLTPGEQTHTFLYETPEDLSASEFHFAVFLQDNSTKEVIQAQKIENQ
ncbi:PEGA domain-containing protein [bacterium]|nr:PEGA domain-containing protein [bacterium]